MKPSVPHEQIAEFCRKWNVSELALFGSVLRDDFRPDSDVDVLLTFTSREFTPSLFEFVEMQDELEVAFGRTVDVVSRKDLEESTNRFRRQAILASARTIFPAAPLIPLVPPPPLDRNPALLDEMVESARLAREFTAGKTPEQFAGDRKSVSAVSHVLGEIGRAAGKISPDLRERHPRIDWLGMARFADRLLYEYRDVSASEVWRKAQDVVRLIPVLEPLIPPVNDGYEEKAL